MLKAAAAPQFLTGGSGHLYYSFGESTGRFLRQIVPDTAFDKPVRIFARKFLGIGTGLRVWRTLSFSMSRLTNTISSSICLRSSLTECSQSS
jgi:hypothetical protein